MEYGRTFCVDVIDPIKHQTMYVNVKICGGPKTLNEGDGAGGRCATFDARLLDQMCGDHPVNDL